MAADITSEANDKRQMLPMLEKAEEQANPDPACPQGFSEPYDARRRAVDIKLFEIMGVSRGIGKREGDGNYKA